MPSSLQTSNFTDEDLSFLAVRALIARGLVEAENFRPSKNKLGNAYLLTPGGIETKTRITARLLQRKRAKYDALKAWLKQLTAEAKAEMLIPAAQHESAPTSRAHGAEKPHDLRR